MMCVHPKAVNTAIQARKRSVHSQLVCSLRARGRLCCSCASARHVGRKRVVPSDAVPEQMPPGTSCAHDSFELLRVVGTGTFAKVLEAALPGTGERVAVKKFRFDPLSSNREITIWLRLSKFDHPNLIKLRHHLFSWEQGRLYVCAMMDYYPIDLSGVVAHCRRDKIVLPSLYVQLCTYQVARGLLFMHSRGVCHRDLKPANVMVNPLTNIIQISDFGSATVLQEGKPHTMYICSRSYRAPELLLGATPIGKAHYSTSVDMWSFACVLAELILLRPLFRSTNSTGQFMEIMRVCGTPSDADVASMNPQLCGLGFPPVPPIQLRDVFLHTTPAPEALKLMHALLKYDPRDRPSALQVLNHSFFDRLRSAQLAMELNGPVPRLFDFSQLETAIDPSAVAKLVPKHVSLACGCPLASEVPRAGK